LAISASSSLVEVAFEVGSALEGAGVQAVLCGGSAATFYASAVYTSSDLDFVLPFGASARDVTAALGKIGFGREAAYFAHPLTAYTLDFPRGPLAVGGQLIQSHDVVRARGRIVRIITPNDSVCDRLTVNAAWGDTSALRAAIGVCQHQAARIDLETIGSFVAAEGSRVYAGAFATTMNGFERGLAELPNFKKIKASKAPELVAGREIRFAP